MKGVGALLGLSVDMAAWLTSVRNPPPSADFSFKTYG
jgi:hypothetical protein